jgi:hypothetical protein
MKPLGLVEVPNRVSDLELPLANGANIDDVNLGTPPTNSCERRQFFGVSNRHHIAQTCTSSSLTLPMGDHSCTTCTAFRRRHTEQPNIIAAPAPVQR